MAMHKMKVSEMVIQGVNKMKLVDDRRSRVIDTFAARHLHLQRKNETVEDYIRYGVQSEYSWSPDYNKKKKILSR